MINKRIGRIRRAKPTRMKIRELSIVRLSVHRTPRHIYAQVVSADGAKTLVCASTLDKELRDKFKKAKQSTGNVDAAKEVGKLIAKRAVQAGIRKVAFDRSGFTYHGRIKALADGAREMGLEF